MKFLINQIRFTLLFLAFCFISLHSISQYMDTYISNEGKGLYFDPKQLLPKSAGMRLVSKKEVPKHLGYPVFYQDPFSGKLYFHSRSGVLPIDKLNKTEPVSTSQLKVVEINEIEIDIVEDVEQSESFNNGFILPERSYDGAALLLPQHHTFPPRLQALNPARNFKMDEILKQLNSLGLSTSRRVDTKGGGFNIIYDRLFINDEDPDKFLVIWLKDNHLFANFLSNNGRWEFENPKIIHNDIGIYDQGLTLKRNLEGDTDKSTLVTELSCIKSDDGYFIGYSINSWESTPGFMANIATCHVSFLSDKLDIVRSVQIPQMIDKPETGKPFATDFQMQLLLHRDVLCAVIQSPNAGKDKLFVQCFDKNLRALSSLNYLTHTSQTYSDLIPVTPIADGFLLTYKEKRKHQTEVYTQLIGNNGRPELPVSVYAVPDGENDRIYSVHVSLDANNILNYYLKIIDTKQDKTFLYHYQLALKDYMKAATYEISKDNWKEAKAVREVNTIMDGINKTIAKNGFPVFKKIYSESLLKTAYVDKDFVIRKYVVLNKRKGYSREESYYYKQQGAIRMIRIVIKAETATNLKIKPGVVTIYYNEDGNKFWEIKENEDGTMEYGEKAVRSNRLLYDVKIDDPFIEFHKNNR